MCPRKGADVLSGDLVFTSGPRVEGNVNGVHVVKFLLGTHD